MREEVNQEQRYRYQMSENADEVPNERSTEGTNGNSVRMGTREAKTATFHGQERPLKLLTLLTEDSLYITM